MSCREQLPQEKTAYVAGPMTGYPGDNFDEFKRVTARLRDKGWDVKCPTEISLRCGCVVGAHTWEEYLNRDIASITEVDAVVVLDGWEDSRGAMMEAFVANKLGKKILWPENLQPVPQDHIDWAITRAMREGVL